MGSFDFPALQPRVLPSSFKFVCAVQAAVSVESESCLSCSSQSRSQAIFMNSSSQPTVRVVPLFTMTEAQADNSVR